LLLPINVKAQEIQEQPVLANSQVAYEAILPDNALQTKLWLPNPDPPKAPIVKASPRTSYVGYWERQCVYFAKQLTGVYGTWGDGGRYLTNNTVPVVGAVIIFRYTHVGVITAVEGNLITFTDRNFDLRGGIRTNVQILATDSSIWKYHKF
jgi:hypothetical protein